MITIIIPACFVINAPVEMIDPRIKYFFIKLILVISCIKSMQAIEQKVINATGRSTKPDSIIPPIACIMKRVVVGIAQIYPKFFLVIPKSQKRKRIKSVNNGIIIFGINCIGSPSII